ncbi:Hypothetical predicted protein [Cloeon dipterum]|uniref:Uncharacterized protein n=1 Tax=Cloeon dipterum TaxID=197152 RepID=A0A8S1DZQ2_9INSE|nr:Hypothetical predicted protein [Cloeon dipterum]
MLLLKLQKPLIYGKEKRKGHSGRPSSCPSEGQAASSSPHDGAAQASTQIAPAEEPEVVAGFSADKEQRKYTEEGLHLVPPEAMQRAAHLMMELSKQPLKLRLLKSLKLWQGLLLGKIKIRGSAYFESDCVSVWIVLLPVGRRYGRSDGAGAAASLLEQTRQEGRRLRCKSILEHCCEHINAGDQAVLRDGGGYHSQLPAADARLNGRALLRGASLQEVFSSDPLRSGVAWRSGGQLPLEEMTARSVSSCGSQALLYPSCPRPSCSRLAGRSGGWTPAAVATFSLGLEDLGGLEAKLVHSQMASLYPWVLRWRIFK